MKFTTSLVLAIVVSLPVWASFHGGKACLERNDYECAVSEFHPVAEEGNVVAQYLLGLIFLHQYVEPPKEDAAEEWLTRAGEGGYVLAQTELARMYKEGDSVAKDLQQMAKWYALAAENGDVGAQLMVADHYSKGLGGQSDLVESYFWYSVAENYWGALAEHARRNVEEKLTADEIAGANARAQEWLTKRGIENEVAE